VSSEINDAHAACGHGLLVVFNEALRVQDQARDGKLDNYVALANSVFENLVGVSVGHMEQFNRQLRIRNR
jgi:hypothetical protein